MAIKNQIQTLVKKEMDRKEFLKYGGGLLLAVIGVTGFLRIILGAHENTSKSNVSSESASGYGMSSYGR